MHKCAGAVLRDWEAADAAAGRGADLREGRGLPPALPARDRPLHRRGAGD